METSKITEENLPLLRERIQELRTFAFGEHYDATNPMHTLVCEEELQLGSESICVHFQNTGKNRYSLSDFLRYTESLADIEVTNHCILAGTTIQVPINYPVSGPIDLVCTNANYSLKVVFAPFLVNLIDAKIGNFTPREYYAIEIYNPYGIADYMESELQKMIDRMLFYLSHRAQKNFHIHSLPLDKKMAWEPQAQDKEPIKMETLPVSSPLLRMYRHALARSNNAQTRFLNFYKIIEMVAPLASKEHLYHSLFDQLKNRNGAFTLTHLNGIISSVYEYDQTIQRKVMAATVIHNCVNDMKELYADLPACLKQKCAKDLNMDISENLDQIYSTTLKLVYDKVGQILYATHRGITQVQSTYLASGDECPKTDLEQLNRFMSKMCYSIIQWNNRQADHIRLKD